MLTSEENKKYWDRTTEGNAYYEEQYSDLREKMKNKNYKQWKEVELPTERK